MNLNETFMLNTQKQQVADALHILQQILTDDQHLAGKILDAEKALRQAASYINEKMK